MNGRFLPLIALMWCMSAQAAHPTRVYHESIGTIRDSTIFFQQDFAETSPLTSAIEMRASLPRATEQSPLEAFSILWDVDPEHDRYYRATLRPYTRMPDDVFDQREVIITIDRHTERGDSLISEEHYRSGFGLERNANVLGVEIDHVGGTATVYGGDAIPVQLGTVEMALPISPLTGIQSEGEAKVDYVVTELAPDPMARLLTDHTLATITERCRESEAPEGVYDYLDSRIDPSYSQSGGDYTLALLKTRQGYDIIYLQGATKNKSLWKEGMLKGRLSPTIFTNHYNLLWFDAAGNPLEHECSADIEADAILTLNFPLLKTSVRYYRLPPDKLFGPSPDRK